MSSKKLAQMIVCYFVADTFDWAVVLSSFEDIVLSHAPKLCNNIITRYGLKNIVLDMNDDGRTSMDERG
jgi:hypothetical protein